MSYPIENNFNYHRPFGTQPARYEQMRAEGKKLAAHILANTVPSREQSLSLTAIEEAIMWANASIARNEKESEAA